MNADPAAFEPIAGKAVLVGVVDEHAFVAAAHDVVLDARLVGVVEQQPVIAIAVGDVVVHAQTIRIHQYVADAVAGRKIAGDLAVVGVHEMHGETQVVKRVAAHDIVVAGHREHAVAAGADVVVDDLRSRRVPQRDRRAALAQAQPAQPLNAVAADDRVMRPVQIDGDQVVFEHVVLHAGAIGGAIDENAGILVDQGQARSADRQPADRDVRGLHPDRIARPAAFQHRARLALDRHARHIDHEVAFERARAEMERVAGRGAGERRDGALPLSHLDHLRARRRSRQRSRDNERSDDRADMQDARADHRSGLLRMNDHPPRHLHVQRVAEPLAIPPVHAGPVGGEGDRGRHLRR